MFYDVGEAYYIPTLEDPNTPNILRRLKNWRFQLGLHFILWQ